MYPEQYHMMIEHVAGIHNINVNVTVEVDSLNSP